MIVQHTIPAARLGEKPSGLERRKAKIASFQNDEMMVSPPADPSQQAPSSAGLRDPQACTRDGSLSGARMPQREERRAASQRPARSHPGRTSPSRSPAVVVSRSHRALTVIPDRWFGLFLFFAARGAIWEAQHYYHSAASKHALLLSLTVPVSALSTASQEQGPSLLLMPKQSDCSSSSLISCPFYWGPQC